MANAIERGATLAALAARDLQVGPRLVFGLRGLLLSLARGLTGRVHDLHMADLDRVMKVISGTWPTCPIDGALDPGSADMRRLVDQVAQATGTTSGQSVLLVSAGPDGVPGVRACMGDAAIDTDTDTNTDTAIGIFSDGVRFAPISNLSGLRLSEACRNLRPVDPSGDDESMWPGLVKSLTFRGFDEAQVLAYTDAAINRHDLDLSDPQLRAVLDEADSALSGASARVELSDLIDAVEASDQSGNTKRKQTLALTRLVDWMSMAEGRGTIDDLAHAGFDPGCRLQKDFEAATPEATLKAMIPGTIAFVQRVIAGRDPADHGLHVQDIRSIAALRREVLDRCILGRSGMPGLDGWCDSLRKFTRFTHLDQGGGMALSKVPGPTREAAVDAYLATRSADYRRTVFRKLRHALLMLDTGGRGHVPAFEGWMAQEFPSVVVSFGQTVADRTFVRAFVAANRLHPADVADLMETYEANIGNPALMRLAAPAVPP